MTKRQKYNLLRFGEETLATIGFTTFVGAMIANSLIVSKTPFIVFCLLSALSMMTASWCGNKARRMRKRRRR